MEMNAIYILGDLVGDPIEALSHPDHVRINRHDLIGGYVGASTQRTQTFLAHHRDQILIVPNAHLLARSATDTEGQEAFYALIWTVREQRDHYGLIFVGPPEELDHSILALSPLLRRNYAGTIASS